MKTKKLVCYNCGGHGFITTTYENGQTSAICPVCGGIGSHEIQMTNADRIRAMSDEELGVWICKHALSCGCCVGLELCRSDDGIANGAVKWLQQPCGGGE